MNRRAKSTLPAQQQQQQGASVSGRLVCAPFCGNELLPALPAPPAVLTPAAGERARGGLADGVGQLGLGAGAAGKHRRGAQRVRQPLQAPAAARCCTDAAAAGASQAQRDQLVRQLIQAHGVWR